jgi:hypothetical protein
VVAFLVAFGLLCLRLGHYWVRVRRVRGCVASLVVLTNSAVVRTAHVIKQSLRGTGARRFAEEWRDAVPMLLEGRRNRVATSSRSTLHFTPTLRRFMVANVQHR